MNRIEIALGSGQTVSIEQASAVVPIDEMSAEAFDIVGVLDADDCLAKATEANIIGHVASMYVDEAFDGIDHTESVEGIVGGTLNLTGKAIAVAKQIVATILKVLQQILAWCKNMVTYLIQRIQGAFFKNMLTAAMKGHTKEEFTQLYPAAAGTKIKSQYFGVMFKEENKKKLDMAISLCEQYVTAIDANLGVDDIENPDAGEWDQKDKTFFERMSDLAGRKVDERSDPKFLHLMKNGGTIANAVILGVAAITPVNVDATVDKLYGQDYLLSIVMKGDQAFGEDYKHLAGVAKTIRTVNEKTQICIKFGQIQAAAIGKENGGGKAKIKALSNKAKCLNFISQFMNEAVRMYLSYLQGAVHAIKAVYASNPKGGTGLGVTPEEQAKYEGKANDITGKQFARQNMVSKATAEEKRKAEVERINAELRESEARIIEKEKAAKTAQEKAAARLERKKARDKAAAEKAAADKKFQEEAAAETKPKTMKGKKNPADTYDSSDNYYKNK